MPKQELQCQFCPKTSSHGAGLASHIRSAHPKEHSSWSKNRNASRSPTTGGGLAGGLKGVITSLEQQKNAIERALAALTDLGGLGVETEEEMTGSPGKVRTKRKGRISPEGRRRLAEAMKRRWAIKRTAAQAKKRGRKAA